MPTLKTRLWLIENDLRIAVTRNTSGFDPKGVVGYVVEEDGGTW